MKRTTFLLLPLIILTGCGKGNFSQQAAKGASDTFNYALNTNPTTLDPGIIQDVDTTELLANVYEGLVSYSEDNKIEPRLAESWTVENGGRTYVFKLRDAKFHDGSPVTAADFKWTIERNCNHAFTSATAGSYLTDIVGVNDCLAGKTNEIKGLEAVDDHTLKITIDQPRAYFIGKLTYPCAFVLPKATTPAKEIATPTQAIGTGPFKIESFEADQEIRLAAFPDYYLGAPKVAHIVRPIIKDAATRLNKYRDGGSDTILLERQDLVAVNRDEKLKAELRPLPRPAVYYVAMNEAKYPPFKDVRVRKAFAMAFDRDNFAKEIIGLPVAHGLIPPGVLGYRADLKGIPYDPNQAQKLLADAGYPQGKDLPPLTIYYRDGRPDSEILAVSYVTDIQKNLGVKIATNKMEWRSFLEARNAKKLSMVGLSWYADYLDPQNFLSLLLTSDAVENRDGYANPEFDRLCREADTTLDEAKRIQLYNQAEDLLLNEAARIPVYFGQDEALVKPRVKGIRFNLFGQMPNLNVSVGP